MAAYDSYGDGVHITFANGYLVSVQWREGNYADQGKTTAEVAVMDTRQRGEPFVRVPGFTSEHDQVAPQVTPERLAKLLSQVAEAEPNSFLNATLNWNW